MTLPQDIAELLRTDPGNEHFVEYAESLRNEGRIADAIYSCLAGVSANPAQHKGRFLLARLFYEQGFTAFAVRELKELSAALPDLQPLKRLIARFEPEAASASTPSGGAAEVVAESEFDISEIELAAEEDEQK